MPNTMTAKKSQAQVSGLTRNMAQLALHGIDRELTTLEAKTCLKPEDYETMARVAGRITWLTEQRHTSLAFRALTLRWDAFFAAQRKLCPPVRLRVNSKGELGQ